MGGHFRRMLSLAQQAQLDRIRAGSARSIQRGVADRGPELLKVASGAKKSLARNLQSARERAWTQGNNSNSRVAAMRRKPERTACGDPRLPSEYLFPEENVCPGCAAMEAHECMCGLSRRNRSRGLTPREAGSRGGGVGGLHSARDYLSEGKVPPAMHPGGGPVLGKWPQQNNPATDEWKHMPLTVR